MTREEAIQKIQNDLKLHHDYLSGDYRKALHMAISALKQPERKTGRWIRQSDTDSKLFGWFICSECGAFIGEESPYCSNCGADMRTKDDRIQRQLWMENERSY